MGSTTPGASRSRPTRRCSSASTPACPTSCCWSPPPAGADGCDRSRRARARRRGRGAHRTARRHPRRHQRRVLLVDRPPGAAAQRRRHPSARDRPHRRQPGRGRRPHRGDRAPVRHRRRRRRPAVSRSTSPATPRSSTEVGNQIETDLLRAELIAVPITLVLLLFVFRGVVAAALPLAIGALSVVNTFLVLRIINSITEVSVFALNLTTAMGLGLAIDYSLFVVNRFREELDHGHEPARSPSGAPCAPPAGRWPSRPARSPRRCSRCWSSRSPSSARSPTPASRSPALPACSRSSCCPRCWPPSGPGSTPCRSAGSATVTARRPEEDGLLVPDRHPG